MPQSKNPKVQKFLDDLTLTDPDKHQIVAKLREVVFANYPTAAERIMYGGILFSLDSDWGGIFSYKNHVSFEFGYGYKLEDPEKLLAGGGKYRRHLKIKTIDSPEMEKIDFFIKQIKALEE